MKSALEKHSDLEISPGTSNSAHPLAGSEVEASGFLKAMAHDGRLLILCLLCEYPRTVGELEAAMPFRQAAVSQQLARLRLEDMVIAERQGKHLRYRISDPRVSRLVETLNEIFSGPVG